MTKNGGNCRGKGDVTKGSVEGGNKGDGWADRQRRRGKARGIERYCQIEKEDQMRQLGSTASRKVAPLGQTTQKQDRRTSVESKMTRNPKAFSLAQSPSRHGCAKIKMTHGYSL